ncbi:hypothetical protein L596_003884 [Steinernema carpocapsae]|uniref:Mitochondrial Rho GTPase n=1 Tax=Steinernema carpocapsae TaxID=34508 RepID=A0A4V6I869_STECR|nr:hypothetical protein L596_003884 [Steinernema carpocapsae]
MTETILNPDNPPADVRILLVGDGGVGKTSLISALIEDEFCETVPPKVENIVIPGDVTPEHLVTEIIDYSPQVQSEDDVKIQIQNASVICVVYAVDNSSSTTKVSSYWLPLIRTVLGGSDHGRPVILVGNKSDQAGPSRQMDDVLPIMNEFGEIETCVECSAKTMKNISETFYYAQKAVIYPTQPLYIPEDKELSRKCRKALVRVFKLCDVDNDGLLNDSELNMFQLLCFGVPLSGNAIQDVKNAVMEGDAEGLIDNGITISGFLYLHQLFIHRGRPETTWTVLRKFGYDVDLQLECNYLCPKLNIGLGCSTELTQRGMQFITQLFDKYDEDKDGILSPSELTNLFSVCPTLGWSKEAFCSVETDERDWLTYNGYKCFWIMNVFMNINKTLEQLAYLGFNVTSGSQLEAIHVTQDRRVDIAEKKTDRAVFQCHVIGPKDAGKTVFCRSFAGHSMRKIALMNKKVMTPYVINSVLVKNEQKYLLLHEVDMYSPKDKLTTYEVCADVICLIYDASDRNSFNFCAETYRTYFHGTKVPCLIVATKVDRGEVEQVYEHQPPEFCRLYQLPAPIKFHNREIGNANCEVYTQLATMAVYPHLKKVYFFHDSVFWGKLALGAAVAGLTSFLVFRNI